MLNLVSVSPELTILIKNDVSRQRLKTEYRPYIENECQTHTLCSSSFSTQSKQNVRFCSCVSNKSLMFCLSKEKNRLVLVWNRKLCFTRANRRAFLISSLLDRTRSKKPLGELFN